MNNQCIDTYLIKRVCERDRLRILVVMKQRIQRNQHLYPVRMRITNDLFEVLQTVTGCLSCTESRSADIDSIRSCLDSSSGYALVACRREEAKRYITMPAVTDTFIECFVPYWGISMH